MSTFGTCMGDHRPWLLYAQVDAGQHQQGTVGVGGRDVRVPPRRIHMAPAAQQPVIGGTATRLQDRAHTLQADLVGARAICTCAVEP